MAGTGRQEWEIRILQHQADMCRELNGYIHPSISHDWCVLKSYLGVYLTPVKVQRASQDIINVVRVLEENDLIHPGEYDVLRKIVVEVYRPAGDIIDKYTQKIKEELAAQQFDQNVVPTQAGRNQDTAVPVQPVQDREQAPVHHPIIGGVPGLDHVDGYEYEVLYAQEPDGNEGYVEEPLDVDEHNHAAPDPTVVQAGGNDNFESLLQTAAEEAEIVDNDGQEFVPHDAVSVIQGFSAKIQEAMLSLRQLVGGGDQQVTLNRQTIINDLFKLYEDVNTVTKTLMVRFQGESGADAGGLTKDAFSCFWNAVFEKYFIGENSHVLHSEVNMQIEAQRVFPLIGRILSHSVALTGIIPIRISRCMLYTMIHGGIVEDESAILKDFLLFLTPNERMLTKKGLESYDDLSDREKASLLDMFSRYSLTVQPRKETFRDVIVNLGKRELCIKPAMYTIWMKNGIPEPHMEVFWNILNMEELNEIYEKLEPTREKVIDLLLTDGELREEEDNVLYFLKDFIAGLSQEDLSHFLVFVTGSDALPQDGITVMFNHETGITGHPVAHTCNNVLELPKTYSTSQQFKYDFMRILNNPEAYLMTTM